MSLSPTLELAIDLIKRRSVTPEDEGCQALMMERLSAAGFHCEALRFGEVDNFWAVRGDSGPLLCFAGHTDVVPTGPEGQWQTPPFEPEISDGMLRGRGAADMKGSLAAMVTACERFAATHPDHNGRPSQGQGDGEEPSPRAFTQCAADLQHADRLLQERGSAQKIDVWVQHQRHDRDRAAEGPDFGKPIVLAVLPAEDLAQPNLEGACVLQLVGDDERQYISRHRQWQQESPVEEPTPRKAAHGHQPRGAGADHEGADADAEKQK